MDKAEKQRTSKQNQALHLFFRLLAERLNENGKDLATILAKSPIDIPATEENVKEVLWRPIQEAMFDKRSTTTLSTKDIDRIYDVINKFLGEMQIECPTFPSIEESIFK